MKLFVNKNHRRVKQSIGGNLYCRGSTMLEVLIAILVLSVGILGMTAVQITGKRNIYEASQRSIAVGLARDIVERMRSNPGEVASYVAEVGGGSISSAPSSCNTAACTPAELAARDLYEWEQALDGAGETIAISGTTSSAGGLVDPRACISDSSGTVTIAIAWKGAMELSNPATSTCGEDSGLYGDSNEQRRVLVLTAYIAPLG